MYEVTETLRLLFVKLTGKKKMCRKRNYFTKLII